MASDEELLRRLEDAAPLLEATRVRYRALIPAVQAWGWRQRLREVCDIAREVARTDAQVEQALRRATRRAQAEAWPQGAARALLDDVNALRDRLNDVVDRRLEDTGGGLLALLRLVLGVPRKVPMGERDAAAHEALQLEDELIPALDRFGTALESLFGRPLVRGHRLPFTLTEYDALLAQFDDGTRALARGWAAIARIDTTGGVERELLRRSKRAPRTTRALPGPRALVHATFWDTAADAHLRLLLEERFAPVQLKEAERVPALRFLLAREVDGAARIPEDTPRAALLMLAHELTASPEGRASLKGGRAQVSAWAAQADALLGDEDWRRVRDGLRALASRSTRLALPPLYRVGKHTERAPLPERLTDFFSTGE
ncbi:MAG: hypothetical protein Q8N23_12370 [Archangium sp.]|nr:hypothetical protein [Archangium sp.]MDP3574700.1 hypothetical protein [Archangium sp.]